MPMPYQTRPTGEVLILMVAATVCLTVLLAGGTVAVVEMRRPETDTSGIVAVISDTVNTLIGLLAGFIAGRGFGRRAVGDDPEPPEESNGTTTRRPATGFPGHPKGS